MDSVCCVQSTHEREKFINQFSGKQKCCEFRASYPKFCLLYEEHCSSVWRRYSIIAATRPMLCLRSVLLASGCEKQLHTAESKQDAAAFRETLNYHVAHGDRKSISCTTRSYPSNIQPLLSPYAALKTISPIRVTMQMKFYALL
jgi:hypothetical protein